jgi:hypothetical protein
MKTRIMLSCGAVLLLLLAYGLGYHSGYSHARQSGRTVVARDTSDRQQSSGKTEFEPYFTKANPIPDRVK